jgi:HAD superfamily hydrolase (TIGR01450 family)
LEKFGNIENEKNPKIHLVGTKELENQFKSSDIYLASEMNENIDFVVGGFDTSFEYRKAMIACKYISKGIPFIATNKDIKCPIRYEEFIPDCGSISKMIEAVTDVKPKFIGKPSKETVNYLLDKANISKDKIAVVGDRLYTDIAMGFNHGICSILVLSGETKIRDLKNSKIVPDFMFDNVYKLYEKLKKF